MKKELENIKPVITPIMFIGACISFYYIDNVFLGSILIVIYILFILSGVNNKRKHKSSIEELKFNIDEAISENMLNLIFPLVLINRAGDIVWRNTKFEDILKKDASEANIISIARGLELSRLIDCDKDFYQKIKIENSLYKVYSQEVSINNKQYQDNIYAVYFNNMSEFNSVDSTKESIILIEVDNLVKC